MDSLYGGKPGVSFILKAAYPSIAEMTTAFKKGENYTDVWYGEYVLIDTINKNHKDNGKIYRRGLDYTNSLGGAEYIGQIVGPSSGTPYFQIDYLEKVKEKAKIPANGEDVWKKYPTGRDSNGDYIIKENGTGTDIGVFDFDKINALVPGKDGSKFNDSIRYTWVNIREDSADADSWFYVGFQIPYLVIDYITHSVSPYDSAGNYTDSTSAVRVDDKSHPFWEQWNLGIPKGIKGDSLKNIRIITPKASDVIYDPSNIKTTIDTSTGRFKTTLGTPGYPGQQEDIANGYKIFVYDYTFYDDKMSGTTAMIYLGDYKVVDRVTLDNDGTLHFLMTHDGDTHFDKKIRWIDLINLTTGIGSAGGHFTFTWNNDNPKKTTEFDISWVRSLVIETDGSVTYTYTGTPKEIPANATRISDGVYRVKNLLQWIQSVVLDPNTGVFTVTNNRGEVIYTAELDWIKKIVLDDDGTLHFWHIHNNQDERYPNAIKWVTGASLNDNGLFRMDYNYGSPYTKQLDWIKKIVLDDDGSIHFWHIFNNQDEKHANVIKWVTGVDLNVNTGVFTMNFNYGPSLTRQLDWIDDIYIDEASGEIAIHHVSNSQNTGTAKNGKKAEILPAKLKLIVRAQVSTDGTISFITNTGEVIQLVSSDGGASFKLKHITDVRLLTGIYDDKHIQIKYNNEAYTKIGDPINYIQDMVVRPFDWHLLVLYNDPSHRSNGSGLDADGRDANGRVWISDVRGSDGTYYGNNVYWRDMGSIKDQAGVLVAFDVTQDQINASKYNNIIEYLNGNYPNGLTGDANQPGGMSTKDKMVTYTEGDNENKNFYAYDYDRHTWYYIGSLSDDGRRDARLINSSLMSDPEIKRVVEKIMVNGVLITAWDVTATLDAIPNYWESSYRWT